MLFELTLWCKQPTLFFLLNIERESVWALKSHGICYLNLATPSDAWSGQGNAEAWFDQKKNKRDI